MMKRQYGVAATFRAPMQVAGSTAFAVNADWTPAAGDVKVSKNGGAAANIATLPTFLTDIGWVWSLSLTEMEAATIDIRIVDAAVESNFFQIETFGHQSANDPRGVVRRATAQAGSSSSITLDASASAVDDVYNGMTCRPVGGTGAGQNEVQIVDYNGTTKVATVYIAGPPAQGRPFVVAPNSTTVFELYNSPLVPLPVNINASGEVALQDGAITSDVLDLTALVAISTHVLDMSDAIEVGLTLRKAQRLIAAFAAGKLSGAGTATEVFRNAVADSKARITATVDASGNRSAITTDAT